jgi:hypothetical protein
MKSWISEAVLPVGPESTDRRTLGTLHVNIATTFAAILY